ncbi:hypothetical protein DBV15_04492 [Temnothorax longispinosus]|uniref:Uncharacterized protein n=1 Tax=Temnothorax longispinosus TaxID=300112 RepID=A0A4S2KBI6_9HYME|nr:hypothetical protein DBV15_04492 [Temnothorax longispinosus]
MATAQREFDLFNGKGHIDTMQSWDINSRYKYTADGSAQSRELPLRVESDAIPFMRHRCDASAYIAFVDRRLNEARRMKREKHLSRKMRYASRAEDSFVETFFSARFLERANERTMANGREERGNKRTTERGWESDPECFSRSKRAFSFRHAASRLDQDSSGSPQFRGFHRHAARCRGKP